MKIEKFNFIKTKNSAFEKHCLENEKPQAGRKYLAKCISNKGLSPRIYEGLSKYNKKKTCNKTVIKYLNRYFSKLHGK